MIGECFQSILELKSMSHPRHIAKRGRDIVEQGAKELVERFEGGVKLTRHYWRQGALGVHGHPIVGRKPPAR